MLSALRLSKLAILAIIVGWIGILIYFWRFSLSFSLIGIGLYLCYNLLAVVLIASWLVVCELFFDTRDRPSLMTLKIFSYKHEIIKADPLTANSKGRGYFLRELKSTLVKQFPNLNRLFPEQYNYDQVTLSADLKRLSHRDRQSNPDQNFMREFARSSQTRLRWKYRDPRLQGFLEQFYSQQAKPSVKEIILFSVVMFLVLIPWEDGFFFAPVALLGTNSLTIVLFAFLFGFAHFRQYSTINCLRIVLAAIPQIGLILPQYGLLVCITGHLIWDMFCLMPSIIALILDAQSRVSRSSKHQSS
jgi:hypothetical protein